VTVYQEEGRFGGCLPITESGPLSRDNGRSWQFLNRAAPETGARSGNPPSMIRLKDGKVITVYYWPRARDKERIIAATIWDPGPARK
jgi:hypothetical protein